MEKFPATVVKLTGDVAWLSTAVSQLQATLAMMAIRPINLENDRHGDNYRREGQEIEKFKVEFNTTTFKQEDDINEKMEDVKEEEGKVDIEEVVITIGPVLSQEDLSVIIPHIDFIFGDEWQVSEIVI